MQNERRSPGDEPLSESELAEAILAYLTEHPEAMDTLEGIAEWWLLRQMARVEVPRVARVLGRLTARGLVEQVGTGPSCRYRAAPGRISQ
jgi:hypothetical protein